MNRSAFELISHLKALDMDKVHAEIDARKATATADQAGRETASPSPTTTTSAAAEAHN